MFIDLGGAVRKMIAPAYSCGCGGIGRHARFRFWCLRAWEFKSPHPHHHKIPRRKTPRYAESPRHLKTLPRRARDRSLAEMNRSEERRVGKECIWRWWPKH